MSMCETRLKTIENEMPDIKRDIRKFVFSNKLCSPKSTYRSRLLDLYGKWDGESDQLLHDFYERRERSGRIE